MKIFCEVCGDDITDEQEYVCDECYRLICRDCCLGGFHNVCTECDP